MSKKYTFSMVVVKPTGKGGKPLKPKEIKPKKKREGGMSNKSKDPKVKKIGIGTGKAKDYPGMKKIIEMNKKGKKRFSKGGSTLKIKKKKFGIFGDSEKTQKDYYNMTRAASRDMNKTGRGEKFREATKVDQETGQIRLRKKMGGGMMQKYSRGGEMLKGGQRKLDANKDGKISGEDFKLIRREKPEMKPIKRSMGSTSTEGNIKHGKLKSQKELKKITDSDKYKKSDYQTKTKMLNVATQSKGGEMKRGYGAARQAGMGLQDENLTPGKTMDYYKDLM